MYSKEKGSLLPLDVPSIQSNPILKHSSERQKDRLLASVLCCMVRLFAKQD